MEYKNHIYIHLTETFTLLELYLRPGRGLNSRPLEPILLAESGHHQPIDHQSKTKYCFRRRTEPSALVAHSTVVLDTGGIQLNDNLRESGRYTLHSYTLLSTLFRASFLLYCLYCLSKYGLVRDQSFYNKIPLSIELQIKDSRPPWVPILGASPFFLVSYERSIKTIHFLFNK